MGRHATPSSAHTRFAAHARFAAHTHSSALGAPVRARVQVPLMNVSTLDQTFLLFADRHTARAMRLLQPHFAVASEEGEQ